MAASSQRTSAAETATFWLSAALLITAVLAGGGRGGPGDVVAQLLAAAVLANMCWRGAQDQLRWRAGGWVRWLPVLALILPAIQLLPIPPALWASAPARAELAAQLLQVGVPATGVISLNPMATERALWSLLPAAAVFLSVLAMSPKMQRRLMLAILILAALSVLLGMVQLADGPGSALRFYTPTNPTEAVGFFANRNHLASLLAMALPLALAGTAWVVTERLAGRALSPLLVVGGCGLIILIVLGIALARSRAGLMLGMLGVLASLPMVVGLGGQRGIKRILAVTMAIAVMISVQFALFGILQRLENDPLDDGRWKYAQITREAATAYAPLGSGLGTFRQAFQPFEAKGEPDRVIVNHAHNDYLELWLEGGKPAVLLLGLAALAWGWCTVTVWRRSPEPGTQESLSRLMSRAAWLAASLVMLHSALDYPLRTTANMVVFAILIAIAFSDSGTRRATGRARAATPDQPEPNLPAGAR